MTRVRVLSLLVAWLAALCVGCASTPREGDGAGAQSFEFLWQSATRDAAVFATLSGDGVLRTAGGLKALRRETEDAFPLAGEEREELRALAERAVSVDRSSASDDARGARSELVVRADGTRREASAQGADAALDELRAAISRAMLRKFRATIEAQPEASRERTNR
ncbi:MAG: hypothetical protein ACKO0W_06315 [Planctomycetota bacterium]